MSRLLGRSWLDAFEEYCSWMECPREWVLWSGISCLSSTLKRSCYLWYRGIKFFPNQYIILVGPPGIGKGEAINKGYEIASETKTINYIKDWHTPQEILEELADGFQHLGLKPGQVVTTNVIQDHTCCIMAPELAVFLQQYDNLHSLMCAWWDQNKFDYKTKNKGKHVIEDMSVSLLGGCVPDYVRSLSKDRLAPITGGFTARTIFVFTITRDQLRRAIEYIEAIRDKVDIVFRSVGESPLANIQAKIVTYIDTIGSTSYKTLLKAMYRDATEDQVQAIIRLLIQVGLVLERIDSKGQVYYESANQTVIRIPLQKVGP